MQVYLTGVHTIKKPKKSAFSNKKNENTEKDNEQNMIAEEDIHLDIIKNEEDNSKSYNTLKKNLSLNPKNNTNKTTDNNNFITLDDKKEKRRKKKMLLSEKDFRLRRNKSVENKKNNEKMAHELKEEYLKYIMLKEPKYADFDKISEDHRKKMYLSFQKYNKNLLIIQNKKEELKRISSEIEKYLIKNYFLKDSSMLPIYEQLIEKVKIDILTKQQEHDGYHKLYEELYNQNYTIKRKVLDEIDIDRINENFYDQYLILKNHAIVQISKKQDTLNQIEEYKKKIMEEHEKEIKQKNKILKDLKLQIEVFKEDEKDLVNKLKKLKAKREHLNLIIKSKENKRKKLESNYIYDIKRYQKSFIGMNKIFRSVNAKNLDDVLLDVNYLKYKFNKLKNNIVNMNLNISDLNSEYSKLNQKLEDIKNDIIKTRNRKKKNTGFNQNEQKRIMEIKKEMKEINEIEYKTKELIQKCKGTFQQGISFVFQKIKLLLANVTFLKNAISPKLIELINNYKNTPFSVDYEKIDNTFLTDFSFLFFQFSNIIFYSSLHSLSSIIHLNINYANKNSIIVPINDPHSLNIFEDGVKKSLKIYNRHSELKHEKQKEINKKQNKKEEQKDDAKLMIENKAITQNQMFYRFMDYLQVKESSSSRERNKNNKKENINKDNKNSFFFTAIDSVKLTKSNSNLTSNKQNINESSKTKKQSKEISISLKQKEDFLKLNKNKVMNLFSKYQNTLVKETDKRLYFQQKYMKKNLPNIQSQEKPTKKIIFTRNKYIVENKRKIIKDNAAKKKSYMLLDDAYEYDEEDDDDNKRKLVFRKNKTCTHFTFFRLNKDRANIYKKMNDLRKLQMSYFGGRFLNTKIRESNSTSYENIILDEFANDYYKRQNQGNDYYNKNNKRRLNFKKKMVDQITANQKLRNQAFYITKNSIKRNNSDLTNLNEKERFKTIKGREKTNSTFFNFKTTMANTKNGRSINKLRKTYNKNITYSKSLLSYKTISLKRNDKTNKSKETFSSKKDKSVISNYLSKKY